MIKKMTAFYKSQEPSTKNGTNQGTTYLTANT